MKSKIVFIFFITFFITSCSLFSPNTVSPKKYLLTNVPNNPVKHSSSIVLLIPLPDSRPVYNTTQMAYSDKRYQLAYFSENEWAETPAQMFHSLLVQTMENTHYFRSIITPPYAGRYDYSLQTEIVKWEQDFTCRIPVFVLSVRAQLIKNTTNQVISTRQFSSIQPLPQRSPYGGVYAGNMAVENILEQISAFTLEKTHR